MDKASDYGSGDCGFESRQTRVCFFRWRGGIPPVHRRPSGGCWASGGGLCCRLAEGSAAAGAQGPFGMHRKHPMTDLRTPKGTRDYGAKECVILQKYLRAFVDTFEMHGAVCMDTPMFELREMLCNKYGEDDKLIFDLADQGGDICSLRFDLTVPFARYLAKNKIRKIRRYQVGKVFRRDQPSVAKGRLREFVQCDFDIAGSYMKMVPDAEVLHVASKCLDRVGLGYKIRVNSRLIVNAYMKCAGICEERFAAACSSIDKLDKMSWDSVRQELHGRGIGWESIKILERYVSVRGECSILGQIRDMAAFSEAEGQDGVEDLELLMRYVRIYGIEDKIEIDLSLVRGLDYYTGVVFESVFPEHTGVGSVVGGGRYDKLVTTVFGRDERAFEDVPCVGFSIGITRMLPLLIQREERVCRATKTAVFVGSSGALLLEERLSILCRLWESGIPAETSYAKKCDFRSLLSYAQEQEIPFFLVVGEKEVSENRFKLMYKEGGRPVEVFGSIEEMVRLLKDRSCR